MFPEGISHDAPSLQALRTGAARIALEAAVDDDIHDVAVVAIGISYDAKARFRSRALVRVGEPQAVSAWAPLYRADPHAAVRALTEDIADRLRVVSPDYRSWAEVADQSSVAEIMARRVGTNEPEVVDLGRREELVRMLGAVVEAPGGDRSSQRLRSALARYQRELSLLGLDDGQVASSAGRTHVGMALKRSLLTAALSAPVALLGTAIHIVPYEVVKRLATVPDNEGMRATAKLLGCLTGFVVVYALLARAVGRRFGLLMGTVAAAFGPASGYVTVHYVERLHHIGGRPSWRRRASCSPAPRPKRLSTGNGDDGAPHSSANGRDRATGAGGTEVAEHLTEGSPRALLGIGDPAFGAKGADELAGSTQVGPGHGREEVVLNLGVEPTEDEAGEGPPGQVAGGEHLTA